MAKSSNAIEIGALADTLANELASYTEEIAEGVKKLVDDTSKDLLKSVRTDARERTGAYKKAMALKLRYESKYERRKVWYVKGPHYRKSHSLEKGHKSRNGGRVKAYPHIEENEKAAKEKFESGVKEIIQNAGK